MCFMDVITFPIWAIVLFYVLVLVAIVFKGISLWKSGRNNQITWFVVLFIFNTLGILPLVYLGWFQKASKKRK